MKKVCLVFAIACAVATAQAAELRQVEVTGPRLKLGDVLPGVPIDARNVDLGAVPAPGGSRIVSRDELQHALPANAHVTLPDGVRVIRKMQRLGASEIDRITRTTMTFPHGVTLSAVHAPPIAEVAAGWTSTTALTPRVAHRVGNEALTVMIEFKRDTEVLQSIPVRIDVAVSAEGAQPDVAHGTAIAVIVQRGLVEVSAAGTMSTDADIGDIVPITIRSTGRTLRVRIESKERAIAVEGS